MSSAIRTQRQPGGESRIILGIHSRLGPARGQAAVRGRRAGRVLEIPVGLVAVGDVPPAIGADLERAVLAYERAASGLDRSVRRHALARLAVLLRRSARHAESAAAWQGVLELADGR